MEKKDFFISYNKADKVLAKWVAGCLEEHGYSTCFQAWDIRPSDDFISKMNEFLENSNAFIPIFSQNYIDSPYCQKECSAALNKHLKDTTYRFIPVRVADVAPPDLLQTIVYIDIFGVEETLAEKRLLNAVDSSPIPRTRPPFPANAAKKARPAFPSNFPVNNLPERNPYFSGRTKDLDRIHAAFATDGAVCVKQAIAGLGGIGKTQLALEYAHRFRDDYADAIWWIKAEKSPREDLLEFAEKCGFLPEGRDAASQLNDKDLIGRLNNWFAGHNSFLLIFDNVETVETIQPFIERVRTGHLLVTTRDRKLNLANSTMIDLDVFTVDEARAFMRERLPRKAINAELTLDKLTELLELLPLALEQAAAYMADVDNDCDCEEYISLFEQHGLKVFEGTAAKLKDYNYNKIVTTTWNISLSKLSEPARQLFSLCAYMAPDNIPLDFFVCQAERLPEPLHNELSNKLKFNEVIQSLVKYALAKREGNFLSIHRLVQAVTRQNQAGDMQWLSCCLNMACAVFEYEYGNKSLMDMDTFEKNVLHILSIVNHAKEVLVDEEAQKKIRRLYYRAGFGFDCSSKYSEARECFQKALEISEKLLDKEHPDIAIAYNDIAETYASQGNYVEAQKWNQKALTIREKVLDKEHPDTATTYNNIASVHYNQGNYDEAMEWNRKALVIREKMLSKEHPDTATTYNNIAVIHNSKGDYAQALEYSQKALEICEKLLGKKHPHTVAAYNSIAGVYISLEEYVKAWEWYQKALETCEKMLVRDHPLTATIYNNIAVFYFCQGEHAKVLEWFQKALAICEKILGREHPNTVATYNNIGKFYSQQGNSIKALEWFQKASGHS
ncbi:MAG: tetratricopeptide repeat protein [Cystobacterineae bacterium]|nr:tetratricopeptide repeat protein [Cystobacterineae bacterium]